MEFSYENIVKPVFPLCRADALWYSPTMLRSYRFHPQAQSRLKVLVADDDPGVREVLEEILSPTYEVVSVDNGLAAMEEAKRQRPDLIILDVRMPAADGILVCDHLRSNESTRHVPVIMISGDADTERRLKAFGAGADDFVDKPFQIDEFQARVVSKIRRVQEQWEDRDSIVCGTISLDASKHDVKIAGKSVSLSGVEFQLLKYFMQNPETVLTRAKLLRVIWRGAVVSDRTVDTHIVALRRKIEGADRTIVTIYGMGYALRPLN